MMTDPYGQTNPRPTSGTTPPALTTPPVGQFTPRMLLAVAALYNPSLLIGYLLYLYGPSRSCVLGGLCGFADFPGIIQLFLLIVGAGTLTALAFVPLWWLLDEARPARDIVSRTARDMMRFVTLRPLMVGYGFVLVVLLILGLFTHRVPATLFLLGLSSATICFWCAASPEFTPVPVARPQPRLTQPPLSGSRIPSQPQSPQQPNRDASDSAFLRDMPPGSPQV
jgi:hypothetical protein